MLDSLTVQPAGGATPLVLMSRSGDTDPARALGQAHYSYGFAAEAFKGMLEGAGFQTRTVTSPEQFKSPRFATVNGLPEGRPLHLIFRSTENIRPISNAYNVACFAWEFDAMKCNGLAEESTALDQVGMLRVCEEVWAPCEYTRQVLERHGIEQVHVIPAPVSGPDTLPSDRHACFTSLALFESTPLVSLSSGNEKAFEQLAKHYAAPLSEHKRVRAALDGGNIFLTVCNPYDKRKNLATLIEGFLMATEGDDDAVLIIKVVASGIFESPTGYLFHQMRVLFGNPHCLNEDRVILFSGFLSDAEMSDLYSSADFYLCTSHGEGQNLPLLEAMAHGCVPVSVTNTAMRDYIDSDNAIVVSEGVYSGLVSGLAADISGVRLSVPFCDRFQVADAVGKAMRLSNLDRLLKGEAAAATVKSRYSPDVVFKKVEARMRDVGADVGQLPRG